MFNKTLQCEMMRFFCQGWGGQTCTGSTFFFFLKKRLNRTFNAAVALLGLNERRTTSSQINMKPPSQHRRH